MTDLARGNTIGRLSHRACFARLRAEGRRWRGTGMVVTFLPGRDHRPDGFAATQSVRVAFAIPRAVGNAVTRNRCRRRVREALRSDGSPLAAGDYLIRLDAACAKLDRMQLREQLDELAAWSHRSPGMRRP